MRQEFKEFMTPRPVIEAIVAMAEPDRTTTILDPCCGSGAFLIYSLSHVRRQIEKQGVGDRQQIKLTFDYAHDKLWGFDTSKQMTAVARINMLVNEDGRAHIYKFDSLTAAAHGPKWIGLKVDIFEGAPRHIGRKVMVCGELMVVRLKKDSTIDPYTLLLFLRSPAGYNALQNCIRGQSGHLYPEDVTGVVLPDFSKVKSDKLKRGVTQIQKALKAKGLLSHASYRAEKLGDELFPCGRKKPIIAL